MYSNFDKDILRNSWLTTKKLPSILALTLAFSLTGCQTFTSLNDKDDEIAESADKTAEGYYVKAIEEIEDDNLGRAEANLKDLRTFYPAGQRAKQALLDLMYVQYEQSRYEEAIANANLFIKTYPNHNQVDYAHYVRGVANMAIPNEGLLKTNQAERDTAYYRLAYSNFSKLLENYPKSMYAPDAAKRSVYLYNQFAEHQLKIAKWYIKREAYVASASRAKLVFQNFPRSESVPESIAILAHSYDKLGLDYLSKEYKDLLAINYPQKLTAGGSVILDSKPSLLSKVPFMNSKDKVTSIARATSNNTVTKPQVIQSIESLRQNDTK